VANRTVRGKQHTVTCHVYNLKSSHEDPEVNNEFYKLLEKTYGNPSVAKVKAKRGKIHNYLAMKLDFTEDGKVEVDMKDYINSMIKEFPEELADSKYPWNENLFKQREDNVKLSDAKRQINTS
jgi:hypothetical protein